MKTLQPRDAYLSVITLGEIHFGIDCLKPGDPVQATHLEHWLNSIKRRYEGRILPITAETAEIGGKLRSIRTLSLADALIGATAIQLGYPVATRNVSDFQNLGINLFNPFE